MSSVIIGKYTLESLTFGMYTDPLVFYREYIQNAVDSIDKAYHNGLISPKDIQVTIKLDKTKNSIVIEDNGIGIPEVDAKSVLLSIGNSKKSAQESRGFRGIGRLTGLGFFSKIIFETSYLNEKTTSILTIEAENILEHIKANDEKTAEQVMLSACAFKQTPEKPEKHFFRVTLLDALQENSFFDFSRVYKYLSQVAPVPFDESFLWGKEIVNRVAQRGYKIPCYNILLTDGKRTERIYKPYKDSFAIDKASSVNDKIKDIELFSIKDSEDNTLAIAWIGMCNYYGSVFDKTIKGLRIRNGNILIGDGQSMNTVFKDSRFNGWCVGEVYVIDRRLLPNARRDDFEKNNIYYVFEEKMRAIALEMSKNIRAASIKRNAKLDEATNKADAAVSAANILLSKDRVSSPQKGNVSQKLNSAQELIKKVGTSNSGEKLIVESVFNELDMLIGTIKGITAYKSINVLEDFSISEKKILEKVFNIVNDSFSEELSQDIIDKLIINLSKKEELLDGSR